MATKTSTVARRSGTRLDAERFDFELGRRGITARRLAQAAGVPEPTLSKARHGRPVAERTLRRITKALLEIPLLVGADMLIAEPEKKIAAEVEAAATEEVTTRNGHARARV